VIITLTNDKFKEPILFNLYYTKPPAIIISKIAEERVAKGQDNSATVEIKNYNIPKDTRLSVNTLVNGILFGKVYSFKKEKEGKLVFKKNIVVLASELIRFS
jgi:hypothetical protein